ncbi:MAG TPA: ABC transporter permease [Chloroflexota bacterium]|jgi:peptide/nickel transport system permease protein
MLADPGGGSATAFSNEAALPSTVTLVPRSSTSTTWRRFRRNRGAVIGMVIVGVYVAMALFANVLAPYDPLDGQLALKLQPPSAAHWLGTDELGRDLLSRLLYGARSSLEIQVAAVMFSLVVGVAWGLISGYFGGPLDEVSMRMADVLLAFPSILLAIGIVAILGNGLTSIVLAVAAISVPQFARLVRGVVLGIRETEYVEAARAIGESHSSIVSRYILPNTTAPIIVQTTLRMATVLLVASGLNFLGLGVVPPTPEWGAMLSNARQYMFQSIHVTLIPGLAITLVVIGFNLVGDGLRDALDPRMRT